MSATLGTRPRAIRRRTSKNGANLKTGQADGQEPQLRERKSGFAEAAKRSVETCSAGRAEAHPSYGGCQAWIVGAGDYFIFLMRRSRAICGDAQSAVSRRTLPCKALVTQPRNA